MHDGSLAALEQVIDYCDRSGDDAKGKSTLATFTGEVRTDVKLC
jgi:hypothetical protein